MPKPFYKPKAKPRSELGSTTTGEEKIRGLRKKEVNFWILSGSKENWGKGSAESIWGVKEGLEDTENKFEEIKKK